MRKSFHNVFMYTGIFFIFFFYGGGADKVKQQIDEYANELLLRDI